tara:strand:+ start:1104 stop:1565 length:462 start_codon:yes stop_codon:yes gene_type:complete
MDYNNLDYYNLDYYNFLPKDNFYYLYFIICVSIIFLYTKFICLNLKRYKDPLKNNFNKKFKLDGWSITHLAFYLLIGYKYPNTFVLTFILGVLWEFFEKYIEIYKPKILQNWGLCETTDGKIKMKWWTAKVSDIFINSLGFLIGMYLHKLSIN